MKQAKRIAECGMMTALSIVVMVVGAVLGIGLYASPMIAGLLLIPLGRKYGVRYHLALWLAVSLLCFLLVPEIEQNLVYFSFFGSYKFFNLLHIGHILRTCMACYKHSGRG